MTSFIIYLKVSRYFSIMSFQSGQSIFMQPKQSFLLYSRPLTDSKSAKVSYSIDENMPIKTVLVF